MSIGNRTGTGRRLRIALLCHYPDDAEAPAGGVWAVGRNLAAGMVAAGAEVHVVSYRGARRQFSVSTPGTGVLHIHPIDLPARRMMPRQAACVPAIAALLARIRPEAVTAHAPEYALAALRAGLPTAFTVHGVVRAEFRVFKGWRNRLPLALSIWQDRQVAGRIKHVVAISDYVIDQYRRRTRAVFHRIDVPIGDVFFEVLPRMPEPQTLLMVGGMNERKDPLTLLQALVRLRSRWPEIRLRIAGRVNQQGFGAKLRRYIDEQDLTGNVELLGSLSQPQLAAAYAASALTVLSSRQETSPAVLMEAMAGRRPVVATDVGGVREIVVDGQTGYLVPVGDVAALADRIEQVVMDSALARSMGEQGRALAEARYRRDLVGREYVSLLGDLAVGG